MAGLGKQMRGTGIAKVQRQNFKDGTFPDLNKDGEITKADILKGRNVPGFKKGGMTKSQETVKTAMGKFKKGKLHSGSKKGPVVKSRKQAIAIALSEAGKSKKK